MRHHNNSHVLPPQLRKQLLVAFSFSLLMGTAHVAQAQTASQDILRNNVPPPPLGMSSPYGRGGKGVYVLPGTHPASGEDAAAKPKLPPLPKAEKIRPPQRLTSELPSPRRLSEGMDDINAPTHRASTPSTFRYIRPSQPLPRAVYPQPKTPQPVVVQPQPMPMVEAPHALKTLSPQIPFGQPSAPPAPPPRVIAPVVATPAVTAPAPIMPQAPQISPQTEVTIEPAIPVTPQAESTMPWQSMSDAPQVVAPQEDVLQEFNAITQSPQPTAPKGVQPVPQVDVPQVTVPDTVSPPTVIEPIPVEPVKTVEIPQLSDESRKIIESTPSGIDTKTVARTPKPVIIKRTDPNAGTIPKIDVRAHEEMGLKIEIRKPDVNVQEYLEEGYENLMNGRESVAAGYYEEALKAEPRNEMALFGLATTYQRMGKRAEARELYGKLLAINPTHREGLNNFMALISNEAPQEAIVELEKLETENPDFSPIPAQLGVVYNKIGDPKMAARKLARALQLSPDNVAYKYNLAVTLDKLGDAEHASDLYLELIEDYNNGAQVPGNIEDIRDRVVFINNKG